MATNVFIIVSAFNLFFYLLVPAFLLWYVYFRVSRKQLYELASKINGSDGLPLIGHALDLMHDPEGDDSDLKACLPITNAPVPEIC